MTQVNDPIIDNLEQAKAVLDNEIDNFSQETQDLRSFTKKLPVILSDSNQSVADGFHRHFYSNHSHLYEEEDPLEALEAELEADFDFLDETTSKPPSKAGQLGRSLTPAIESRSDTVEVLKTEKKVLGGLHYKVDREFRQSVDQPPLNIKFGKDGRIVRINLDVFENELLKDPNNVRIPEYMGKLKSSQDHLGVLAHYVRRMIESMDRIDPEARTWIYQDEEFENPVLDGIGTSMKTVRQERKKVEEFQEKGTEHDYLIEVWSDYLQTETQETPWSIVGTEIDYLGSIRGENRNHNREFDLLLENEENGNIVYLEVKPGSGGNKKARKQIERASEFDQICLLMGEGETKYMGNVDVTGYIVEDLPDYTKSPVALIEDSEHKSVIT